MWVNDGRPCLTSVPLSLPRIWVIASTLTAPHLPLGRSPLERVGKGRGICCCCRSCVLSLSLSISSFSATTCSSLTFNRLSVISGWYFFVQRFLARTIYPHDKQRWGTRYSTSCVSHASTAIAANGSNRSDNITELAINRSDRDTDGLSLIPNKPVKKKERERERLIGKLEKRKGGEKRR